MDFTRCELCLEKQPRLLNNGYLTERKSLENIVHKLFSLKLNVTDGSAHICTECHKFLSDCVKFYDKVRNARRKVFETNIKKIELPFLKNEVSISPVNIKNDDQTKSKIECFKKEDIPAQTLPEDLHLKAEYEYEDGNIECACLLEAAVTFNHREPQDIRINNLVPEIQKGSEGCPIKINAITENNFPSVLFNDGKLIPKGKALKNLLNKFYNLFCDRCHVSPTFKSVAEMFEHHKTHHNVRGYVKCCDSKLHDRRQIALHMARHLQPSAFECPICKKLVSRPGALKSHMQSYHLPESERPYKCDQCEKSYAYLGALTLHKAKHLPEKEKKVYECEVCQKKFTIQTSYNTHISIAHSTDKFICAVCGKGFRVKTNYLYHLSTHERNRTNNVQCQVCDVTCVSNQRLRIHMKRHGSKNYSCEQCLTTYYTASDLRNHKKMKHTDLKPFKCSLCTKSFRKKQILNQHMAQHTGEKRHVCEFCLKTFRQSGNYYTHRKRMHPEYKNTSKKTVSVRI